jgi:sec-independent protein translocase protein TatA
MPFRMGPWEIGLIVLIILIIFGVGKLPQVGSALGKGIRAFKKGQSGEEEEKEADESPEPKKII